MADSKPSPQPQPAAAGMPMWMKIVVFYGRFAPSFTAVGYAARGLPLRPLNASFKGQTWLVTGATGGVGIAAVQIAKAVFDEKKQAEVEEH